MQTDPVRALFPCTQQTVYLNTAGYSPGAIPVRKTYEDALDSWVQGNFDQVEAEKAGEEARSLFGQLIGGAASLCTSEVLQSPTIRLLFQYERDVKATSSTFRTGDNGTLSAARASAPGTACSVLHRNHVFIAHKYPYVHVPCKGQLPGHRHMR